MESRRGGQPCQAKGYPCMEPWVLNGNLLLSNAAALGFYSCLSPQPNWPLLPLYLVSTHFPTEVNTHALGRDCRGPDSRTRTVNQKSVYLPPPPHVHRVEHI